MSHTVQSCNVIVPADIHGTLHSAQCSKSISPAAVLILSLSYSGVFNGYSLALEPILSKSGISQTTAGKIGFIGLLASVPANVVIGALGSAFTRYQVSETEKGVIHRNAP